MTVEFLDPKVARDGDDNATSFSFPFVITEANDLVVNLVDDEGVEDTDSLEQGVDYSVVPSGTYPTTGSISYPLVGDPLPTGWQIVLRRVLPLTQTTRLRNQGGYFAEVQERTFDRLAMQVQQLQEQIDRAFLLPLLGFEGLAGAVPRVNATETAIEYALGLQGSPGADGAAGPAGPAGPWEFITSYDLTGESVVTIDNLGTSEHVSVMLKIMGLTVTTDNTNPFLRVVKNALEKTDSNYRRALFTHNSGDANDTQGTETANAIPFVVSAAQVGNVAGENLDAEVIIDQPHVARVQHVRVRAWWTSPTPTENASDIVVRYTGTDAGAVLDALTLTMSSSTFAGGTVLVYGLRAENAKVPVVASQFTPGVLGASEIVLRYVFTEDATIGIDFAGSQASAGAAATAEAVFGISLNGSPGPTMTFAIAGDTATFDNSGADLDVVAGDVLEITAPATPDATLADLAISIRALADID